MKKLQQIILASIIFLLVSNCIQSQTIYTVSKTTDPDPFIYAYDFDDSLCDPEILGTLQWAIRKANDTGGACIINFNIETPAPYKIRLNNYLPVIESSITIDGTTQPGYVEGTPIINIENNSFITTCFSAYGVDELTIKGFLFHNFISCGISLENCNYSTISDNIITLLNANFLRSKIGLVRLRLINCTNIDVFNNQFLTLNDGSPIHGPDNYGIAIYNSENCTIGADLNSNIIEDCSAGIMLDSSQNIRLIQNEIYGGVSSILLNNGSNNNKREAFLLNYNNTTINGVAQANDIIEVFGSDDEDDANIYLGTATADAEGKWSLETSNEYFFFTATATDANNTSELCNVMPTNSICSLPYNLQSTEGINTTHTLSWETNNNDTVFQLAVGVKGISAIENEWVFAYTPINGNSITLSGFDENTVYEYYVHATCESGVSHWVGAVDFNFINNPIETTQLIADDCGAIDIFFDQILTTKEIEGVDSYEFLVENTSLGYSQSIIKSANTFTLNEFTGVDYNRTYNIKVRTIVGIDTSTYGDICQIQTIFNPLLLTEREGHSLHGAIVDTITGQEYTPSMYVYDRFGDSTLLENIRIPNNSEIAGLFRLHFIDEEMASNNHGFNDPILGPARRAVVIQVYRDLSELLRPDGQLPNPYPSSGNTDRFVEIEIQESDFGMSYGAPAHASQWYLDIQNGLTYGNVWEYINTGVDPYLLISNPNFPAVPSYHGYMRVNFDNLGFNYNLDLNQPAPDGILDLYSLILHEALHTLGFASLVADDGTSRQTGTSPGRYSPWDIYLHVDPTQTNVLDFDIDADCYDAQFNPILNSNNILGVCDDINMQFIYPGISILNSVYTDPNYNNGGSVFSHFNCTNTNSYVMNQGISTGYNQRYPHPKEVQALCAIGYEISGTYGEGGAVLFPSNNTTWTYTNSCPEPRVIAGANDFGPYDPTDMFLDLYEVMAGDPIDILNVTQNDYPNLTEICCVEIVVGDGNIPLGLITPTGFTYETGGTFVGEAVIKYRPLNSQGQRGNIAYVFIQVTAPPLPPCVYTSLCDENLICHGDFEGYISGGSAAELSYFCIEGTTSNSTDIHNVNGNTFLGISAYINEACVFELTDPIHNGEVVNISFLGSKNNINQPLANLTCNFLGSLNSPCNTPLGISNVSGSSSTLCPAYTPISMGSQIITNETVVGWPNFTIPNFTMYNLPPYTNNTGDDINFIVINPNQASGFILIDDIIVNKINNNEIVINSIPNFTSHLCPGDNLQYTYEVCASDGIPATPVTLVYEDQFGNIPTGLTIDPLSDFDPITGEVIIQPADWDVITGCVDLSLVLTVNGNALPGSIISNIINVQEGACINGDPVEDFVEIGNSNILEIIKNVNVVGNLVTYDIEISNLHTTNSISNIIVEDIVPIELININTPDFTIIGSNQLITTTPLTIGPLSSNTLTFTAEINPSTPCVEIIIENCASITSADGVCLLPIETCVSFQFQSIPIANVMVTPTSCPGNCDGEATINVSGGTPDYLITVNGPGGNIPVTVPSGTPISITLQDLCVGNYSVTVTDNNSCIAINNFSITQPPLLSASVESLTNQICTTLGSATIFTSGGTSPYTYIWPSNADGVDNNSANELVPGPYNVTVVDANDCETQIGFDIINDDITINASSHVHQNLLCNGDDDGIIKVTDITGTPDFTISWEVGSSINTSADTYLIGSLNAGTYNITVTDTYGCLVVTTTDLIDNPLLTAEISTFTDVICFEELGSATVVAVGGTGIDTYTYLWDDDIPLETTHNATDLPGGIYNVTVTDGNGCEASTDVTIWQNTNINPSIDEIIHVTCFGDCDGAIIASATGGVSPYIFKWNDLANQTGEQAVNLCAGEYIVTITDSHGCTATHDAIITENPQLEATITSNTISCFGINSGSATVTPIGGTGYYTYLWDDDENQETATADDLAPGTYNVTVYDGNMCEAYVSVIIEGNPEMSASITYFTDCICYDNLDGSATVTPIGGVDPYSYEWDDEQNTTTQTVAELSGGIYHVTVTDENGCEAYSSVSIAGPNEEFVAIAEFTDIACFGETSEVTITATGGTVPYNGTGVFYELPGTHSYTITDGFGCIISETITIEAYEQPDFDITVIETCSSQPIGAIDLIINGIEPTSYLWSNNDEWTQDIFDLSSGYYNVTITYADYCEYVEEDIYVDQYQSTGIVINSTHAFFLPIAVPGNVNFNFSNLHYGEYTLVVTDNNNDNIATSTFDYPCALDNPDCIPEQIDDLAPGLYDMILTDENGCSTTTQFSIDLVKVTTTDACYNQNNGQIVVSIVTYGDGNGVIEPLEWTNGDNSIFIQDTDNPNLYTSTYTDPVSLESGVYVFTAVDLWENSISSYAIVAEEPYIDISVIINTPAYGDELGTATITLNPNDIDFTGYQVTIDSHMPFDNIVINQNLDEPIVVEVPHGDFDVIVENPTNGCDPFRLYDINMPSVDDLDFHIVDATLATCTYYYSGTLTFELLGGVPPYDITIYFNNDIVFQDTYYSSGEYSVDLTDLSGTGMFNILGVDSNNQNNSGDINNYVLHYAYSSYNTLTNDNIEERLATHHNHFIDKTLCIGNELDQSLIFNDDVIFENCTIYTATHPYADIEETQVTVYNPNVFELRSSTMQSGCPDQMWQGIRGLVVGVTIPDDDPTAFSPSQLLIYNSKISDAIKAVESCGGGNGAAIVKANSSKFYNNKYDLYFNYSPFSQSSSLIYNNDFVTNSIFKDPNVYPRSHVYLNKVYGLNFKKNDFINTLSISPQVPEGVVYTTDKRGKGIESRFSSFIVTPVYFFDFHAYPQDTENTFTGLYYAIDARGQRTYAPQIYHNEFVNNYRGIYLQSTNGARVLFNYLTTTEFKTSFSNLGVNSFVGTPNHNVSYGVYLNSAKNTKIEENTIVNGKSGVYVYNLGDDGTVFYLNDFGINRIYGDEYDAFPDEEPEGMTAATVVVGSNSDYIPLDSDHTGETGLQVKCNDYADNAHSISVVNGNMRQIQGTNSTNTKYLAGNQFHETFVNGMEFEAQEQNEGIFNYSHLNLGGYDYFHHDDNASEMNGFDRVLHDNKTELVYAHLMLGVGFDESESCLSHYTNQFTPHPGPVIGEIAIKMGELDDMEKDYERIVDKGDKWYMKSVAKLMNYDNYTEAYEILQNEGYLSDTVLLALICNEIAPSDAIAAILIENSPLPDEVVKLIEELPIHNNIKNWLSFYSAGLSNRVEMEYQIADIKQEITYLESELINNAINNDSLPEVKTTVIEYFNSKPEVNYKDLMSVYKLEMALDMTDNATLTLDEIRSVANTLPAEESEELFFFCDVNEIYINSFDETIGDSALMVNKVFLFEAASRTSVEYSALAEILYSQTTDSIFFEYTPLPIDVMTPKNFVVYENTNDIFTPQFKVYPNPTKGLVFVEYNFDKVYENGTELLLQALNLERHDNCNIGTIRVFNSESKLIETINLENESGFETINLNRKPAGLYLVEITDCYGNTNSVKIVKNQ